MPTRRPCVSCSQADRSAFALSLEGGRFSSCTTGNEHRRFWLYVFTEGAAKQNSTSKFHVVRVKKADPGFTLDPESYSEVSLIQRMSISVDGRSVVVPRSAFTDLFNVRKAWLIVEKGSFVLSVGGADGADLYLARTYFDSRVVHRRAVDACALDMFSKLPFVY